MLVLDKSKKVLNKTIIYNLYFELFYFVVPSENIFSYLLISSLLFTLPNWFRGILSIIFIKVGTDCFGRRSLHQSVNSFSSNFVSEFCFKTNKENTRCPHIESVMPITATSSIRGCPSSSFSMSRALILKPSKLNKRGLSENA